MAKAQRRMFLSYFSICAFGLHDPLCALGEVSAPSAVNFFTVRWPRTAAEFRRVYAWLSSPADSLLPLVSPFCVSLNGHIFP